MKEITTIEEIHSIELEILKNFDKFCRCRNLKYSLSYGTLIGAIRHNGFIPWDDDLDVWMPRDDYNKLIEIYQKEENNGNYIIVNGKTNPRYYRAMSKLIDRRTILNEKKFIDGKIGVFIDIWPLDGVPKNKLIKHLDNLIVIVMNKFLMARMMNAKYLRGYKKVAHYLFQWINPKKLVDIEDAFLNHVNSHEHEEVTCYTTIYKKDVISCNDLFKNQEHVFEGEKFLIFSNYDCILKNIYGNYMQMPAESERKIRHPANIFWK